MNLDFTTFTKTDPGDLIPLTVADCGTTANALSYNIRRWVWKDMGAGYFSGDFVHDFEFVVGTSAGKYVGYVIWLLGEENGDATDLLDAGVKMMRIFEESKDDSSIRSIGLEIYDGSSWVTGTRVRNLSRNTLYYVRVERVGTVSTLRAYLSAANRESDTSRVVDQTVDAGEVASYRYIQGLTNEYSSASERFWHGRVSNLVISEPAPSGYTLQAGTCYIIKPTNTGGPVTTYTALDGLPDGMALDPVTGWIQGTPTGND